MDFIRAEAFDPDNSIELVFSEDIEDRFSLDVADWRHSRQREVRLSLKDLDNPRSAGLRIRADAAEVLSWLNRLVWVVLEEAFDIPEPGGLTLDQLHEMANSRAPRDVEDLDEPRDHP